MNLGTMANALVAMLGCEATPDAIFAAVQALAEKRYENDGEFFLLSLKHSRGLEVAMWWRPAARGYTRSLADAGRYTAEDLAANPHYNDGVNVAAIPVAAAIAAGFAIVPINKAKELAERQVAA